MPPRKRPKTAAKESAAEGVAEDEFALHDSTAKATEPPSDDKDLAWKDHPAKLYLKKCFINGAIPMDYQTKNGGPGPRAIWDKHCKDNPLFANMCYGQTFTTRLLGVRNDNEKKMNRKDDDQKAFDNYRANHPRPTHDHKGIPLWDGSPAQKLLKEIMARGEHVGKAPKELWESKEVFKVYTLDVFRNHIYQEKRLWKMHNYLEVDAKKKKEKRKKKKRKKKDKDGDSDTGSNSSSSSSSDAS
jgi:hypothetical protein